MGSVGSRFKVMSLTDSAAERVREIMSNSDQPAVALKVGVKNGGCAGMSYTMEWAQNLGPHDEVVEEQGVKIVVDPKAILFLLGTELDFETTKFSSVFVFRKPHQAPP